MTGQKEWNDCHKFKVDWLDSNFQHQNGLSLILSLEHLYGCWTDYSSPRMERKEIYENLQPLPS